jgi:hypothetical protein
MKVRTAALPTRSAVFLHWTIRICDRKSTDPTCLLFQKQTSTSLLPGSLSVLDQHIYIPDFAVWFSSAPKTIKSPVVIEVTSSHRGPAAVKRAVDRVRAFTQAGDTQTGLIIVPGRTAHAPRVASLAPLIFVLGLQEFQSLLTAGKLVETLRRERNRFAHSAG